MKLPILVALALFLPTAAAAQAVTLTAELVAENLSEPLYATAPAGDPRLFIVEQTGAIRILADGAIGEAPFLDLGDIVSSGGERGLLGLAFHPAYAENGRFFVNYTDAEGDTQVVGYRVSDDPDLADESSAEPILAVDQPFANHNGGWLDFGPDGFLYIAMGDGGGRGDPQANGQNPDVLLAKILRIDVDGAAPYAIPPGNPHADGGGAPEIFVSGVRNPWRNSFDGDDFYIADVGQGVFEEITVLSPADAGANLGWSVMEGPACYGDGACDAVGLVPPLHAYDHSEGGCSITGGYVYRGAAIPELAGAYVFADYCSGQVWSLRHENGAVTELLDWTSQLGGLGPVTSFGRDAAGELYFTTIEGNLFRIVRAG